jgi:hypothetical protein
MSAIPMQVPESDQTAIGTNLLGRSHRSLQNGTFTPYRPGRSDRSMNVELNPC